MADLIDRISGVDITRPKINLHRLIGVERLYALGEWSRSQIVTEFDLQGSEATQAGQIADVIDARYSVTSVLMNSGNLALTNMPLALTEMSNTVHRRIKTNFANIGQIRLSVRVSTAGVSAAILYTQYSTDESAWSTLTTNTVSLYTPTSTKVSAWENVPTGAKASDVFVRLVTSGGDGNADPVVGNIYLQTKSFVDRLTYIMQVESVLMCIEDNGDRFYHDVNGVVNKSKVYEDLQIAGS